MDSKSTLRSRIIAAMRHAGIRGPTELARLVSVETGRVVRQPSMSYILDPDSNVQTTKYAEAIAAVCGVSYEWLSTGHGRMKGGPAPVGSGHELIRYYDITASAGHGRLLPYLDEREPQSFRIDWLRSHGLNKQDLFCADVAGDSMSPTIPDGHTVLINSAEKEVRDGKVYLINSGGYLSIKRLYRRFDGGLTIKSDNPTFAPTDIPVDQLEHVNIIGRVVWHAGTI